MLENLVIGKEVGFVDGGKRVVLIVFGGFLIRLYVVKWGVIYWNVIFEVVDVWFIGLCCLGDWLDKLVGYWGVWWVWWIMLGLMIFRIRDGIVDEFKFVFCDVVVIVDCYEYCFVYVVGRCFGIVVKY